MNTFSVAALYTLFTAAWLVVSWAIVPSIIAAAHDGRSLRILNRLLSPRLPLADYLDRWADVSTAVLLAAAVHLLLLLSVRALDRRHRIGPSTDAARTTTATNVTLLTFSFLFLIVTALSGARHDYFSHLMIWDWILQGDDPWTVLPGQSGPLNAYGPLFNALALLVPINPFAPKLLLAAAYLLFVIWLLKVVGPQCGRTALSRSAVLAWIVNPLPWMEVAFNGHFDILVGVLSVAAIHARLRGSDGVSGTALGLGVLLKFLPIVMLPFLVIERRRIRPRLVVAAIFMLLIGAAASVLLWGSSLTGAMSQTVTRQPTLLSIFRFLRGEWSPLLPWVDRATVDAMATPVLITAGLLVFAWSWLRAIDPAKGAVLAVLTTVMFYQVGYVQYRFVLFVIVSYWWWTTHESERAMNGRFLSLTMAGYFGALAAFDVFYSVVGGAIVENTRWGWIQEVAGAPAFVLETFLLVAVLRSNRSRGNRARDSLEQRLLPISFRHLDDRPRMLE